MANSGTWFDTKAGKVVTSQPEEGIQLAAPGVEPTPDEQRRIDVYKDGGATGDATVTTSSTSKK